MFWFLVVVAHWLLLVRSHLDVKRLLEVLTVVGLEGIGEGMGEYEGEGVSSLGVPALGHVGVGLRGAGTAVINGSLGL